MSDIKDPYENPKDKLGTQKAPLHLIPSSALVHTALAFRDGATKYGPYNWREKTVVMSIYISAAQRHIAAFLDGEDIDPESGVHNLGHGMACLAIILDALTVKNIRDDRPKPAQLRTLLDAVRDGQIGVATSVKWKADFERFANALSNFNAADKTLIAEKPAEFFSKAFVLRESEKTFGKFEIGGSPVERRAELADRRKYRKVVGRLEFRRSGPNEGRRATDKTNWGDLPCDRRTGEENRRDTFYGNPMGGGYVIAERRHHVGCGRRKTDPKP